VALLTEMLSVCILAMEIKQEEAATFGMEINWSKTKMQAVSTQHYPSVVYAGNEVEVVDCFTYVEVQISNDGSSEQDVRWHIAMTRETAFKPYRSSGVQASDLRRRYAF